MRYFILFFILSFCFPIFSFETNDKTKGQIKTRFVEFEEFKKIVLKYEKDILKFKGRDFNAQYLAWLRSIRNNKGSVSFDPKRLPSEPRLKYKDNGWTDWKEVIKGINYSFDEFQKIIQENKDDILKVKGSGLDIKYRAWLNSVLENKDKLKLSFDPKRLPLNPWLKYKDKGWVNWKKIIKGIKYSFDEFKKIIQEHKSDILKFEGRDFNAKYRAWLDSVREGKISVNFDPKRLPLILHFQYKGKGWTSWGDLGFKSAKSFFKFHSFDEFKKIVQEHKDDILKFEGRDFNAKYRAWLKSVRNDTGSVTFDPHRLPLDIRFQYKGKGWTSWGDLGFKPAKRVFNFYSFDEFKKIIQEHKSDISKFEKIGSKFKYQAWLKSVKKDKGSLKFDPHRLHSNPDVYYKNQGWPGWGDFDFVSIKKGSHFYPFDEFKKIIQEHKSDILKFEGKNFNDKYRAWLRSLRKDKGSVTFNPKRLPLSPYSQYKNFSWKHFALSKSRSSTQRTPPHKAAQKKATRR